MNEQRTFESDQDDAKGDASSGSAQTVVVVTPGLPNGKEVPVQLSGSCANGDQVTLQPNQDYDITFQLTGANGVKSWNSNNPFGNQTGGSCPQPTQGANPPFSVGSGGSPTSITVHMTGQASGYTTHFRLNFNDSFTSDPIIVVN